MDSPKKSADKEAPKAPAPVKEAASEVKAVVEKKAPEPKAPVAVTPVVASGPVDYKAVREAIADLLDEEK